MKENKICYQKINNLIIHQVLHLRPAGVLSQAAMKFKSDIKIVCGEKEITAKSVLNVMAAGIKCGTEINLICDGPDEEEALKTLY